MSTSNQTTQQDQRADRTNTIATLLVGCVLLGIGGFVLVQNSASFKLPDNNKLWADTWKKKVLKPWDPPKFEPTIDWSDPKNDPNKIAERLNLNKPLQIQQELGHQFQPANPFPGRR
ncbi:MAG TPA: hypothetical protein VEI07_10360 [Planctomycetaceae bacterium]|nr:hypothetical protein [Planctomycetaceae bacterium]